MTWTVTAFLLFQSAAAKEPPKEKPLSAVERVIAFAVEQETRAAHLEATRDLCVSFDTRLDIDEKEVLRELKRNGLKIHPGDSCNRGARGFAISVGAPVTTISPGVYEVAIALVDLSPLQRGEDLALLLRRGTYVVRCDRSSEAQLISYRSLDDKK